MSRTKTTARIDVTVPLALPPAVFPAVFSPWSDMLSNRPPYHFYERPWISPPPVLPPTCPLPLAGPPSLVALHLCFNRALPRGVWLIGEEHAEFSLRPSVYWLLTNVSSMITWSHFSVMQKKLHKHKPVKRVWRLYSILYSEIVFESHRI